MKIYLIGYDKKAGQNYEPIEAAIREFKSHWRDLDTTWIIKSKLDINQVAQILTPYLDENNKLLIVELSNNAKWVGFKKKSSDWLNTVFTNS